MRGGGRKNNLFEQARLADWGDWYQNMSECDDCQRARGRGCDTAVQIPCCCRPPCLMATTKPSGLPPTHLTIINRPVLVTAPKNGLRKESDSSGWPIINYLTVPRRANSWILHSSLTFLIYCSCRSWWGGGGRAVKLCQ